METTEGRPDGRRTLAIVGRDTIARRAFLAGYDIRKLPDATKHVFAGLPTDRAAGSYEPYFHSRDTEEALARLMDLLEVSEERRDYFRTAFVRETDLRLFRALRIGTSGPPEAAAGRLPGIMEAVKRATLRDFVLAVLKTEVAGAFPQPVARDET